MGEFKIAVLAIHSVNLKIYYSLFRARSDDFNISERKLHDIKIGDEIIYKIGDNIRKYKVDKKVEIDSYDWSYLNQTNDNRITLITCIDNEPSKRLVVQAVE